MVNNSDDKVQKFEELKKWFIENPKLPKEVDDLLLKRFLKCMQYDMDETKALIEHNYYLRNRSSRIFLDRDPSTEEVLEFHEMHDIIQLPGLTPEGHKILFYRMHDCPPHKVNSVMESKVFYMLADCRFTALDTEKRIRSKENELEDSDNINDDDDNDHENHIATGDVQIIDIGQYTLSHMARASFLTIRTHMKYLQEAYPVRLRATHIINCPPFMDKMIKIMRPFIRDEVYNLTRFHTEGLDSLYECVPQDMLPNEYGGKAGTIAELKAKTLAQLDKKRSYLMDEEHWKIEQTRSRWSWW